MVVFSNDGPLGGLVAQQNRMPAIMTGLWQDLNWLGNPAPSPSPTVSSALRVVTSPLLYSKIFCPASLFILGLCAWFCFRQWGFANLAATLGGLAAALSSHFFSTACWGVAAQVICVGMNFVAIGLLGGEYRSASRRWASVALAGMAVGMSIMEGYDIGAIFSLFVAAFGLFHAIFENGAPGRQAALGVARVAVVALCAAFLAAHALDTLIGTQIKGVSTTAPEKQDTKERWDYATQWSFPPHEILRVLIPGLFGYRMDTPKDMAFAQESFVGGAYWGRAGETPGYTANRDNPEWTRQNPGAMPRFSGGGEYAGVLVVLIAAGAIAQAFRRQNSAFTPVERKHIWFWAAAAAISLLLAFGRYAPFYQFFYMLPYFNTIRNPAKFTHTFHFCLVILFAYGVNGLHRLYMAPAVATTRGLVDHLKHWWSKAEGFDRKWSLSCLGLIGLSILGYLIYGSSRESLLRRISSVGFSEAATAEALASYSVSSVAWFILWLMLSVAVLLLIVSGRFAGKRAAFGSILMGAVLLLDLSRANLPWIIYQDYKEKYASNPVIDFLRERAYEHRVAILPFPFPRQFGLFGDMYRLEWAQHHFPFYNVQSLDVIQNPRPPMDQVMFERAMMPTGTNDLHKLVRRWELTNTRYLLGPAGYAMQLNQELDASRNRFRVAQPFDITAKPGVTQPTRLEELTAVPNAEGPYGVIEFTGALPRASLYYNWRSSTNDQQTLELLGSREFDPRSVVLVAGNVPAPGGNASNTPPAAVEYVSYAPKKLVLKANPTAPAILLLNDKFDPSWKVTVDGKPVDLLRANFIMRGVYLSPGPHEIAFHFTSSMSGLYVSLAAIALALGLIGFLGFAPERQSEKLVNPDNPAEPQGNAPKPSRNK